MSRTKLEVKGDQIGDLFKLGSGIPVETFEPRKIFFRGAIKDLGEQVIFPLEMVIDHRFGGLGGSGDLDRCGGLETVAGEKYCSCLEESLFLFHALNLPGLNVQQWNDTAL